MKVAYLFCFFYFVFSVYANGEPLSKRCEHHIRNLMEWVNLPATFVGNARYNNPEDSMTKSLKDMVTMSSNNIVKEQLDFTNECAEATAFSEADNAMLAPSINGLFEQIFLLYQNLKAHQTEIKQNVELEPPVKELINATRSLLDFYLQWKATYKVPNYFMIAYKVMLERDTISKAFGVI